MIRNWRIAYCPTLKGKVWNDLMEKCLKNILTENKNLTEHSLSLHGYWIINWSFIHSWVIQTGVSLLLLIKLIISLFYQWSIPLGQWLNTCTFSIVPYLLILIVPELSCQWFHTSAMSMVPYLIYQWFPVSTLDSSLLLLMVPYHTPFC